MPGGPALARLTQERKSWRKDHPFGFVAKPSAAADGMAIHRFLQDCSIPDTPSLKCLLPGKKGTDWEQGFFHPNVYESGKVCLSIINDDDSSGSWKPSISVKQILQGVQALLTDPNNDDAAQSSAYYTFTKNKAQYAELVRKQAKKYRSENKPTQ